MKPSKPTSEITKQCHSRVPHKPIPTERKKRAQTQLANNRKYLEIWLPSSINTPGRPGPSSSSTTTIISTLTLSFLSHIFPNPLRFPPSPRLLRSITNASQQCYPPAELCQSSTKSKRDGGGGGSWSVYWKRERVGNRTPKNVDARARGRWPPSCPGRRRVPAGWWEVARTRGCAGGRGRGKRATGLERGVLLLRRRGGTCQREGLITRVKTCTWTRGDNGGNSGSATISTM